MKNVGKVCETLLAPAPLKKALAQTGKSEHFAPESILFRAGGKNAGVYLVCSGEVCLDVPGVPQLTRSFATGSILGLPSTFSEKPYSLTAKSATECDVVHVNKNTFLELMKAKPELCRLANDILCREVTFILSAVRGQAKSPAAETPSAGPRRAVNG